MNVRLENWIWSWNWSRSQELSLKSEESNSSWTEPAEPWTGPNRSEPAKSRHEPGSTWVDPEPDQDQISGIQLNPISNFAIESLNFQTYSNLTHLYKLSLSSISALLLLLPCFLHLSLSPSLWTRPPLMSSQSHTSVPRTPITQKQHTPTIPATLSFEDWREEEEYQEETWGWATWIVHAIEVGDSEEGWKAVHGRICKEKKDRRGIDESNSKLCFLKELDLELLSRPGVEGNGFLAWIRGRRTICYSFKNIVRCSRVPEI